MKSIKTLGLLAIAGVLSMTACKKKEFVYTNNDTNSTSDLQAVYDRTVNYTVQVTAQKESGFRSDAGVSGATVAVSVGGQIQTATTDANGLAVFTGLRAGSAAVTISASNHTTAHLIVDLSANVVGGSSSDIDSHSERTAATMVKLLPVGGLGSATLMGTLEAERDLTSSGFETVPDAAGASLVARVDFNNFSSNGSTSGLGYGHTGDGRVIEFYYEGLMGTTTQALNNNSTRRYSMTLPATAYGLDVEVLANPYMANYILSSTTTETRTFTANSGSASSPRTIWSNTSYTGEVYVSNILYRAL